MVWCLAFRLWFRNRPEEHPAVNSAELALIGPATATQSHTGGVPWKALFTHPSVWMICIMYSLVNYGWIFNITYLPGYMKLRFSIADGDIMGSIYKGAPLWIGAVGCVLGGVLISRLSRMVSHRHLARQIVGVSAMLLSATALWGAVNASGALMFCGLVSLGAFGVDLTLGAIWASCQDIGQKHAAVTAAAMNTIGAIGAAIANWHTGTIVEQQVEARAAELNITVAHMDEATKTAATLAGYQTVYSYSAIVFIFAAICWLFIRVDRPLVAEE